jgi:hypothetical protein
VGGEALWRPRQDQHFLANSQKMVACRSGERSPFSGEQPEKGSECPLADLEAVNGLPPPTSPTLLRGDAGISEIKPGGLAHDGLVKGIIH